MRHILQVIIICVASSNYCNAQYYSKYIFNEADSTIKLAEPLQIKETGEFILFDIYVHEKLKIHVYHVSFEVVNTEAQTLSISFGTEGHLIPVTTNVILKPGESSIIKYDLRKVKSYFGFSQVGRIRIYQQNKGEDGFNKYREDLSGDFFIAGEWSY